MSSSATRSVQIGAVPPGGAQRGQAVPPGLVGERLDVAVAGLQDVGLESGYDPVIPAREPLRDWGVCSTVPSAGRKSGNGVVVLHIGHFKCGGGSNSPVATDSTRVDDEVKAAWHRVTDAMVRRDGSKACADMAAVVRHQLALQGKSCPQFVRQETSQFLMPGDVRYVTRTKITYVTVQGDRAAIYYQDTNGMVDLGSAVFAWNLNWGGSNNMQRVGGKWLLAPD